MEHIEQPVLEQVSPTGLHPSPHSAKHSLILAVCSTVLVLVAAGVYVLGEQETRPPQDSIPIVFAPTTRPTQPPPYIQPTMSDDFPDIHSDTLSGKLVYRHNGTILVSNTDGSNVMKLVDAKNKPGFAGWSDGGKIFYYTELVGSTFTLYKKDLSTNNASKIFDFEGSDKNIEFYTGNADVSSDGTYVIYSRNKDIHLYDIVKKSDRKLLTHVDCSVQSVPPYLLSSIVRPAYAGLTQCHGYYFPMWSADGQRVVIRKIFYEGATQIVINPFEAIVQEKDMNQGGNPVWSLTGRMLAIAGGGYGPGKLNVIRNVDNPVYQDAFLSNPEFKDRSAISPAWSSDNRVAFSYADYDKDQYGIALYDSSNSTMRSIISTEGQEYVQLWLPDNKTILLSDDAKYITKLDTTTLLKQTFPITADALIEIIP